ncbi:hypothetical protein RJ640_015130 [Escallonia rubra]|uniref:Terpene synthase metal-binding domain-containing protein n=1 Tax=Escallonia rubra TaxID=112253 RepID=A0AA88R5M0_9ASTE|nr:hypothetical protein RJ640_015130 [Escallonia rubra]
MLVAVADKPSEQLKLIDDIQRLGVVHGEDILEEALAFTTTQLESVITQISNASAAQIIHALKQPIHKGLTRLEARHYISIYQAGSHNKALLKFAKLDFNLLQKVHRTELSDITRWWKDLNFAKKLPFARDRVVECYFWILSVYFEPQYAFARMLMTKIIALTSVIDDIYDVYGTLEELVLFTNAIERRDISALDQLPRYMKLCYQSLLDVYDDIDGAIAMEGKSYRVHYAKAAMKQLVRAYFHEAKWLHEGYIPAMEYMQVALVSCDYFMLATTSFVGMGDLVTKESFEWVSNNHLIVRASSVINRLMDDIVGPEEKGKYAMAVEGSA